MTFHEHGLLVQLAQVYLEREDQLDKSGEVFLDNALEYLIKVVLFQLLLIVGVIDVHLDHIEDLVEGIETVLRILGQAVLGKEGVDLLDLGDSRILNKVKFAFIILFF